MIANILVLLALTPAIALGLYMLFLLCDIVWQAIPPRKHKD